VTLGTLHIGVQVSLEGRIPEAAVDQVGVGGGDDGVETGRLLGHGHLLQLAVGLVEHHRRRSLIDLPRFYAHQTVLQVVNAANAVLASNGVEPSD
jgi:hypothetical protein